MTSLVLTVIAPDKPGLVEQLSQTIATHGGNWLESNMSRLAGKFAGILIVSVATEQSESLQNALQALESQGLKVTVESSQEQAAGAQGSSISLELIGHDKPGIVRDISHALSRFNINVERLSTELVSGSMSAEELFKAEADLTVPANVDLDDLQQSLEDIASDLMVDITLN
ncbi:glycine cleavage system protein R [Amphritea japonica]|uniref:Glycine cleavage system transcriptional repressor n=1 Tax=Amphritea japonica ATCC BAA-1530 TaxID=1278309 RepID=A0A7R6PQU8_9GAMM|nr:ACT domain-containing protein [Amphritea japonica]BBB27823.1 glycine cleavage system R protein [Amphritea japonica ATCC BAA-1530]